MKKLATTILLLASAHLAFAQQKYFSFTINGKHGITDTSGNEIVKPVYGYFTLIEAKKQIYLQDFSERPDIIFDRATGVQQLYERVYDHSAILENVPYTFLSKEGNSFLLSEQTNKIINLNADYYAFKDCGQYIVAKYFQKFPAPPKAVKDKNGLLPPPMIESLPADNLVVLDKTKSLKPVMKGAFKDFLLLYKVPDGGFVII